MTREACCNGNREPLRKALLSRESTLLQVIRIGAEAQRHLEKALGYTALKLVHTCFESVQGVKDMTLYSAKILQLSLNLLRQPDVAIGELLGIQTSSATHATAVLS